MTDEPKNSKKFGREYGDRFEESKVCARLRQFQLFNHCFPHRLQFISVECTQGNNKKKARASPLLGNYNIQIKEMACKMEGGMKKDGKGEQKANGEENSRVFEMRHIKTCQHYCDPQHLKNITLDIIFDYVSFEWCLRSLHRCLCTQR